jgi:hypothetical protein
MDSQSAARVRRIVELTWPRLASHARALGRDPEVVLRALLLMLALLPPALSAQDTSDPLGPPARVQSQPFYRAPDGSSSRLGRGDEKGPNGYLSIHPDAAGVTITIVIDDAGGCGAPHSVEHAISRDTLNVTIFDNLPSLCPGMYNPTSYKIAIAGLTQRYYQLRLFREGRSGRGGAASGASPWIVAYIQTQ